MATTRESGVVLDNDEGEGLSVAGRLQLLLVEQVSEKRGERGRHGLSIDRAFTAVWRCFLGARAWLVVRRDSIGIYEMTEPVVRLKRGGHAGLAF